MSSCIVTVRLTMKVVTRQNATALPCGSLAMQSIRQLVLKITNSVLFADAHDCITAC